ncbi:MAG: IS110 family transposase [Candidatus Thiodiazotropha sp. (ex Dulcina madagascariensis)]|nr:IS110 family transposase [Candidatus Thiodiazotropha sp. (ex Dulcina madagascariensis)]
MKHYCGIDLHSNNHVVVVIDEEDKRVFERRLNNDLSLTLKALSPFQESLQGIAVESTFNWYWLVDGLQDHGFGVRLVNTAAVTQYNGLKYSGDHHDAYHLAHLMRLGILPTGYIYPKKMRTVRDLLRRRLSLVRSASSQLVSVQSQIWRSTGIRVKSSELRKLDFEPPFMSNYELQSIHAGLSVFQAIHRQVADLEETAYAAVKLTDGFKVLQTITGVGKVLGLTIQLETGDIDRFADAGKYASYCRCVDSKRTSNGKKKGEGNAKAGNKYLSWAFSEAAHFAIQYEPLAKRFYERKKAKTNGIIAIRAIARKLARASWMMLKHQIPYDAKLMFPS